MENVSVINLNDTNDEFINFLMQKKDLDSSSYPLNFNLSIVTQYLKSVYESRQKPTFHSVTGKTAIEESVSQMTNDSTISDSIKSLLSLEENSEKSSVIYKDLSSNTLNRSPIIRGAHSSILYQSIEIYDEQRFPVIDIHTHPDGFNFSFNDIGIFLLDIFPKGSSLHARFVNVICIVTNAFQFLILPSLKTPIFSDKNELTDIIANINNSLTDKNLNTQFQVTFPHNNYSEITNQNQLEQIKILSRMVERSEISTNDASIKTISLIPNHKEKIKKNTEILKSIKIENDSSETFKEIAQLFDLVFYRSSDFAHFEKVNLKNLTI